MTRALHTLSATPSSRMTSPATASVRAAMIGDRPVGAGHRADANAQLLATRHALH